MPLGGVHLLQIKVYILLFFSYKLHNLQFLKETKAHKLDWLSKIFHFSNGDYGWTIGDLRTKRLNEMYPIFLIGSWAKYAPNFKSLGAPL